MKEFVNRKMRKLKPECLIDEKTPEKDLDLEGFFLVLATVFNDIKGIMVFFEWRNEYRSPPLEEVSVHSGEYGGLTNQLNKMLAGILHESLDLLNKNIKIIESEEFKKFENRLSGRSREIWRLLVDVAVERPGTSKEHADLVHLLEQIRHNAAFHYYQSATNLVRGFRKHFYSTNKESKAFKWAYYSSQRTEPMKTRFYYADAALQGYILDKISATGRKPEDMYKMVFELSAVVGRSILDLVSEYHESKPQS